MSEQWFSVKVEVAGGVDLEQLRLRIEQSINDWGQAIPWYYSGSAVATKTPQPFKEPLFESGFSKESP